MGYQYLEDIGAVIIDLVLSAISGSLLVLIFPKISLYLLAYAALVPLFIAARRAKNPQAAAFYGFVCGLIFFGGNLFWINILAKWAGFWANTAWVLLIICQAVFLAVFAAAYRYSMGKFQRYSIIIVPLLWTAIEWIRSLGPYGVTGGGLSYSQTDLLPMLQLAFIFGSYGISFLIVLVNEAIVKAVTDKKPAYLGAAALLLAVALLSGYYRINAYRDSGRQIKVAVIQANVAQDVKLDYGLFYDITNIHESMSRMAARERPDIIIWPETAVTTYLFDTRTMLGDVKKLVRETGAIYLIGTPFREKDKIYNSVAAMSKSGDLIGRYDKQRLVPFGEYLPFRPVIYRLLEDNSLFAEDYNSNPDPKVLDLGVAKAGVVICFESTLPYLVKNRVRHGAQFILVATNDAWFFDSAAIYQHLAAAKMRAVENNMYVVQAANTGISAIIDPVGRITDKAGSGQCAILSGKIFVH